MASHDPGVARKDLLGRDGGEAVLGSESGGAWQRREGALRGGGQAAGGAVEAAEANERASEREEGRGPRAARRTCARALTGMAPAAPSQLPPRPAARHRGGQGTAVPGGAFGAPPSCTALRAARGPAPRAVVFALIDLLQWDEKRQVSCTANGLLFDNRCLLAWNCLWWQKAGDAKMFDRIKPSDEASASSAQGMERQGSLQQDSNSSLHSRRQEHPRPGVSTMQNRQGYCNCCHVHYSNLEQHIFSSQHRHFTTYCRNRMGTSSLMERFLQDVLQHHPHRYHDNRPTYDDMPLPVTPMSARIASSGEVEKKKNRGRQVTCSKDQESIDDVHSSAPCLSHEHTKETFVTQTFTQKSETEKERVTGTSQMSMGSCSNEKCNVLRDAQIANHSHEGQFTAVSPVPQHFSDSMLVHSSSVNRKTEKNTEISSSSNRIPHSGCDNTGMEVRNRNALKPALALVHPKCPSVLHQNPVCSHRNSLHVTSGQSLLKRDDLQTQDETLVSDFCLRDTVGISSSLGLGTSPPLARCKNVKMNRGDASSVDETIENVILKYCHGTAYEEFNFKEENNLCSTFSPLLDHADLEGSEMSFDCDAPIQSGADLPKAAVKDIELLKEVQISLQDKDYGTQLSSVLKSETVKQIETVKQNIVVHPEEAVLPALPHVPPSFVGKTWSQIMYEDDIKIEELVRDFREGRFRCYFDSESSANCAGKRMKKKKQKDEKRNNTAEGNRTETASVKALPEFNNALSGGSDFDNPSLASDGLCNPQILKTPRKRTWRLASRCQVVKVSHGTQTSLLNYPVTKRKMTRRESDPSDQKASIIWPENEKTPNMKTRLCALKLPESYSKIMSPVQPKTVVYVLSCPEMKQCKGKPVDIPKMRKNRNSTDSKDSVRYKYKQCSFKYYDPLTNRILKMPPKGSVGEKAKKPSHVRQLFRSLSFDANMRKLADAQREGTPTKSFNRSDFYSSSSATCLPESGKGNDTLSSQKADGSSVSTERTDCLVSSHSENSFKQLVISPLGSHQSVVEGDDRLTPFNSRVTKAPLTSIRGDRLDRENPKAIWKRKESTNKEPFFSKKAAGAMSVRCTVARRGNRVTTGKQTSRTKKQQKEGMRRKLSPCAQKSSSFPIHRHQTRKTTVGKHLKKEKPDAKKLNVRKKSKRTFLNSAVTSIPDKRQKGTSGSFPKKPERASSKVRSWEVSGDRGHPSTVNRPSRRTSAVPLLRNCIVLPGES